VTSPDSFLAQHRKRGVAEVTWTWGLISSACCRLSGIWNDLKLLPLWKN